MVLVSHVGACWAHIPVDSPSLVALRYGSWSWQGELPIAGQGAWGKSAARRPKFCPSLGPCERRL